MSNKLDNILTIIYQTTILVKYRSSDSFLMVFQVYLLKTGVLL